MRLLSHQAMKNACAPDFSAAAADAASYTISAVCIRTRALNWGSATAVTIFHVQSNMLSVQSAWVRHRPATCRLTHLSVRILLHATARTSI